VRPTDAEDLKDAARLRTAAMVRRFDWRPTAADQERLAAAIEAAKPENLLPAEPFSREILFSSPAADANAAPNTDMYQRLLRELEDQVALGKKGSIRAAVYGIDDVPDVRTGNRRFSR
jgi:hypothetical protein